MSDTDQDPMRDLAPGYALGALTPEETRAFEAALARRPDLQREVAEYRETGALLAEQSAIAPSPGLRARLLDRVRAGSPDIAPAAVPLPGRKPFAPVATAMALVAMVLLSVGLTLKVRVLADALRSRDSLIAEGARRLEAREATLNAILEPEVQLTTLTAVGTDPVVQIFYNKAKRQVIVHAFRLAPAAPGRVYQLWLMPKSGNPIASRTFNTEADGHALVESVDVPEGEIIAGFAVSVEPEGGSPQPTSAPILYGAIPSR
jgi:anti-sigma-K factor RskA